MADSTCSVDGCDRAVTKYRRTGLCSRCYQRRWWHGDPATILNNRGKPVGVRFAEKVERSETGCWLWTANINRKGYGMFQPGRKMMSAHRWSYEHHVGPVPDGLQLDHLCRVRHCVNPEHLEPVTAKENQVRSPFDPAARTHCKNGHPYDEANTYIFPGSGGRACRICRAEYRSAYMARKGAESCDSA